MDGNAKKLTLYGVRDNGCLSELLIGPVPCLSSPLSSYTLLFFFFSSSLSLPTLFLPSSVNHSQHHHPTTLFLLVSSFFIWEIVIWIRVFLRFWVGINLSVLPRNEKRRQFLPRLPIVSLIRLLFYPLNFINNHGGPRGRWRGSFRRSVWLPLPLFSSLSPSNMSCIFTDSWCYPATMWMSLRTKHRQ